MTTRSTRLFVGSLAPTRAIALLFTAPAAITTLVKQEQISAAGAQAEVQLYLSPSASGVNFLVYWHHFDVAGTDDHQTWFVMNPGDQLLASVTGAAVHLCISGAHLPLPPP